MSLLQEDHLIDARFGPDLCAALVASGVAIGLYLTEAALPLMFD